MAALVVPTEIWLGIASSVAHKDYLSSVLVCRDFYHIFTELLYSDLVIKFPPTLHYYAAKWGSFDETHSTRFAPSGPRLTLLFERLDTHPTLRNHVRVVHAKNLVISRIYPVKGGFTKIMFLDGKEEDPHKVLHDCFVDAVMNLLRSLPHLKAVEFTDIEMETRALVHLASGPGQNLMIRLTNPKLYGVVDLPSTPVANAQGVLEESKCPVPSTSVTARALAVDRRGNPPDAETLAHFLSAPSMKVLSMWSENQTRVELYRAFTLLGRPQLPHLHSVTIPFIKRSQVDMLGAMTNLRELKFAGITVGYGYGYSVPTYHLGGLMPRLKAINTYSSSIFNLTSGRSIVKIGGCDNGTGTDWIDLMAYKPRFGSNVMVRTFEWKCRWESIELLLDYFIEKNPGVWHLSFMARTERVYPGRIPGKIPGEEVIERYISKFVKLPELRSIYCKLPRRRPPTVESLIWEEEQCRYLQGAGCPSLVSVSFGYKITWIRHPDETTWRPNGPSVDLWVQK